MFVYIRNTTRETISSGDIFLNLDLQSSMYLMTSSSVPLIINFRASLIMSLQGARCRRLHSLDTHDLQFRVLIPTPSLSQTLRMYRFLAVQMPRSRCSLASSASFGRKHLHTSQGPDKLLLDKRFQFVLADLVNDPHNLSLLAALRLKNLSTRGPKLR